MTAQIIPVDPDNARTLASYANEIRVLRKQASSDIIEIGRMLIESKKLAGHGNWLDWLEREFRWTDDTALNYMRVHDLVKNRNFRDLSNIPVSGLFLLAAPSTPEPAKQEIISRAEAGESMPVNTVKEIVGHAKQAARETRRDAGIHNKQIAAETSGPPQVTFSPIMENWTWYILAVKRHFEDAMGEAKKLKHKISRAEVNAIAHAFNDIAKLAMDTTEEMMNELKARGPK
jgi:hypothetical protein